MFKDARFAICSRIEEEYSSHLDAKGIRVPFVNGQVLMWPRGNTIEDAIMIGEENRGLYKLKGHLEQALVHDSIEPR